MQESPLILAIPFYIRFISGLIYLVGYIFTYYFFPSDYLFLGLFLWTWMLIRGLMYAPEMRVYSYGIETCRFGFCHFTSWNEISHIRFGELNSQIYLKNLKPIVRILIYNSLFINAWRNNYKEAIALMKIKFETAQYPSPQRVYDETKIALLP